MRRAHTVTMRATRCIAALDAMPVQPCAACRVVCAEHLAHACTRSYLPANGVLVCGVQAAGKGPLKTIQVIEITT